jgi:hypothetical protein
MDLIWPCQTTWYFFIKLVLMCDLYYQLRVWLEKKALTFKALNNLYQPLYIYIDLAPGHIKETVLGVLLYDYADVPMLIVLCNIVANWINLASYWFYVSARFECAKWNFPFFLWVIMGVIF